MASEYPYAGDIDVTRGSMEYEWKIPYFFSQEKKYKKCQSQEFEFVGAKWQLLLKNNASLQLSIIKTEYGFLDHPVNYTIGIKGFDGTLYKSVHGVMDVQYPEFYESPKGCLRLSDLLPDKAKTAAQDVLTVFCNLSVRQEYFERTTSDSTTQTEISEEIGRLRRNLKHLLTSGEDSDVVMKVGDREFRAHRAILRARSTVFASMFGHDTKERSSGTVNITDCDPQIFELFLLHVYTGKVDCLSPENVCHLYQVADKYDIQDLKTECVEYMQSNFSADTFCDVIRLALRHKESELVENATQFFMGNVEKILITVKWLSFLKQNPVEANELTIKAVNFLVRGRN